MTTPSIRAYPNLLRPGSPVLLSESYAATFGRSEGIVFDCGNEKALVAYHADYRSALIPLVELRLSLATDTGMCHAARWLAQRRGHPPGSTAPEWSVEWDSDGALCWRLRSGDEVEWFPAVDTDLTDAQALAAACVAVGGAS